jgi:molybdopterin/thiamine biosynthesis adenylyltransferase
LGPLGIEIAKNIVLAGCKELILHDTCSPTMKDIAGGQFFLTQEDLKSDKTRAQLSRSKLK